MTREEAVERIKMILEEATASEDAVSYVTSDDADALDMAIKALEQEPILDKIRAEIKDTLYVDSLIFGELIDFKNEKISADDVIEEFNRVTRMEVLQIIDKYKSEE
jgi:hypothetical protein